MLGILFITRIHKYYTVSTFLDILRISKRNQLDYNKYVVGVELNETDAKVSFAILLL